MINNINDLNKKIDMINELIPTFDTDERKEIKKNNKIIVELISELSEIKDVMIDVIHDKKDNLVSMMNNVSVDEDNVELIKLFDKVKYVSNNSFVSKLDIDKNLYEIRFSGSLEKVNENVLELIDKFLLVGVSLNSDSFRYSLSLYKYMDFFFKNKDSEDFGKLISNLFDSLYWECPDLVLHIYLSFMLLLDKNSDKFESYIKKNSENGNYEECLLNYFKKKIEIYDKINCNEFLCYNKFLSGELRVEDYLPSGIMRKEIISKYVDYDKYLNYSSEDRNYFYEQVNGMYLDLSEYLKLSKYSFLVDKVKEIYLNKSNHVGSYASMRKKIRDFDRQRDRLNCKLFNVYNRLNGKTNGFLFKKYNSLFNKVNVKIMEIIEEYRSYDEVSFVNDVVVRLNDDSTYYDVLKIYENNYGYLVKLLIENNCDYDDFINFLYNPYLSICKSLPFISEINIKDKLINKYDLFDMNFNLSDDNKLREELKYIIRLWYFDKGSINLDKFKLIFDTDKIKKEEI